MTRPIRRPSTCRRFTLRPLPLALAIALVSAALPARAGSFTNVQQAVGATISEAGHNTDVHQSSHNAYIQAEGFGIAATDTVRVFQPGTTSNLLIQVSGYDPSQILGALQANGRVFLSNPNGVLFGAGARIDVGSLVATNLSVNSDEFMQGRVHLFDAGNSVGSVVNAGTVRADGTVALVGTDVTNSGSIDAARVGLAALTDVVVDVEGDGLIFFQMSGERASAKLQQLGSIKADGGLVELRAEARGAMADTVLNMDGIIQARSIGSRNGQVIIDGGSAGITRVNGTIDVQGTEAGETGGTAKVLGDKVALGPTALIDASGMAAGGTVLVGGNYQGSGDEHRASHTRVAEGATLKANALDDGDGGTVVVWADGTTAFQGLIEARGGAQGGNGGTVEVSGKQALAFWGMVNTDAAHGALGTLLLDPDNIFVVATAGDATGTLTSDFSDLDNSPVTAGDYSVLASSINASTANITLAATNNITVNAAIDRSGTAGAAGKSLTLTAGNSIAINQGITTNNGALTLNANSGAGTIALGANLNTGTGSVVLNGKVSLTANVSITAGANATFQSTVDSADGTARALSVTADTVTVTGRLGGNFALGNLTLTLKDLVLSNSNAIGAASGAVATIINRSTNGNIDIAAGSSSGTTLNLSIANDLARFANYQDLVIGAASGSGNITQDGAWNLPTNVTLRSGSGNIQLTSSINAASAGVQGLTLSTSGTIEFGDGTGVDETYGASAALAYVNATGTIRILSPTITTTGQQTYTGAVTVGQSTTLTSSGGDIAFTSTLNSDSTTRNVTLSAASGSVTLGGIVGGSAALGTFTVTGATALNTTAVSTTGNQVYNSAVTVGANTTLTSSGGNITFGSTLDADSTARDVTLVATTASKSVTLSGAVGATNTLGTFTVNAVANINGGDATTAAVTANTQDYKKNVTFGGAGTTKTLVANSLVFGAGTTIAASTYDVTLRTNALTLNTATSTGGGELTLVQRTASGNIGVGTAATETLNLAVSDLAALDSFSSVTIGDATDTSTVAFGATYTLAQDTTLAAATSVTLLGITGATHDLTLATGNAIFNGNVSGVGTLTTTGAATLNANLGASTLIDIGGTTTLSTGTAGTTRTIDATTVTLNGLAAGDKNIALKADTLNLSGTVTASSGSNATITTHTADRAIALETGTGATDLEIGAATLAKFAPFSGLTIGSANSAISATSSITLPTALTLVSGTGTISLAGVNGAGFGLTLTGSGDTTLSGTFTNVASLTANGGGKTLIATDLATSTSMSFSGGENVVFTTAGTSVTLSSGTLNFSGDLDVNGKDTTLRADSLSLTGDIDNAPGANLAIEANSVSLIRVNASSAATALDISTALLAKFSGFDQITIGNAASGASILTGAISLPVDTVLTTGSGDITLGAVTGATHDLTLHTASGDITFQGNVSGVHDLLTTGTPGGITINAASIATTHSQVYNADITLGAVDVTLSAPSLQVSGSHTITTGTHDLALQADTLSLGGGIASSGSDLTIATFTLGETIGVLGGAGTLQVDTTLLGLVSGFDLITIGRADSTAAGTITVGDAGGGTLTLPAKLALLSGAADIQVLNPVSSAGGTFSITSTTGDVTIAQGLGSSGSNLASLSISTGGDITLQGVSIFADAATFDGDVVLATNGDATTTTTTLSGGTFTFTGDIRGTAAGVQSLYANTAALTKLQGNVGVNSATRLFRLYTGNAEVGGQLFATDFVALYGDVTLTADTSIASATVYLGASSASDTFAAGTHDLAINADVLNVALHSVTGGDQWSLAPLTAGYDIRVSTTGGGAGILLVNPNALTQWGSFAHMTLGSTDTGDITIAHTAAITLGTDLTLLSGTGDITITSALQGAHGLTIDTDGLTRLQADLGASGSDLSSLTITGKTELAGGGSAVTVRTSGNQDYQDDVTVGQAATLLTTAGGVRLRGTVDAMSGATATADLSIDTTGGNARFDDAVGATAALHSLSTNIALINGASVTTQGDQTYHGGVTLSAASTTLTGATITFDSTVSGTTTGAQALVIDATSAVLKGAVGTTGLRLASLEITGASTLSGGSVYTTGAQTYTGAVTLGANTQLTATTGDIVFTSTVNGDTAATRTLAVNTAGTSRFSGAVGGTASLASLSTDAAGTTELGAAITTSGAQTYNDAVDVTGTVTLTAGGNVSFLGDVNGKTAGAGALSVNTAALTRFAGDVGAARALASLSTNAAGATELGGDITTTGAVSLLDAVTLTDDLTITHGGLLTFGATVDGAQDLTLDGGAGNAAVVFSGTVGGTTALNSLTTVGTGNVTLQAGSAGITTTNSQQYGGDVLLSGGSKHFLAGILMFDGGISGASGTTTFTADGLSIGGTLSGSGALVIEPYHSTTTIGVGEGPGASGVLRVAQSLLDSTASFSSLVIGRIGTLAAINVGTANLGTHTTLLSDSGSITLNDAVNSLSSATPVDLTLTTGGAIALGGDLGRTNALREISASHAVSTPNAAGISIAASRVALSSTTDFVINDLRITGGGSSLIQTAQRLVLTGDIDLSGGGTIGLVSTVSPTKVAVTDPEYAGSADLTVGLNGAFKEASAGITQTGGKIVTSAGTTLYVRTTQGASIDLMSSANDIQGGLSAVAGRIGEAIDTPRLTTPDGSGDILVSFVRVASRQINVLGQPVNDADQSLVAAGIEGDAVVLSADRINTSANNGLIRARLPYDNNQGTLTAVPGLTLLLSGTGLNATEAYGGVDDSARIQVSVGNSTGGYITVRPKGGASLGPGYVSLGGSTAMRPFYDGNSKVTEVPVFYNGDVPQTPQEVGALSAVTAVIEEARRQRFEEAVRTENVSARLRSGVIAEVGAGRPATEGSDSIRMPASCTPAPDSLSCQ